MIIYGKKNLRKLMDYSLIPGVGVHAKQFWFLPIYRVKITYYE